MPEFSSSRERRLWVWALVVVVAIYSTADLARMLADALRESGLLELSSDMFNVGMLLVGAMILVQRVEGTLARRRSRLRSGRQPSPHSPPALPWGSVQT